MAKGNRVSRRHTAASRVIFHVDMDAFFAAIEQRDNPELRGKPVVVGAPPDKRGVVCTCSYEARRYGIHSAMPSRTAYGLCPRAIFLPVRKEAYSEASRQLMSIFERFTSLVEKISIDEAFLDMTPALRANPDYLVTARQLKECIRRELRLTASVGIAPNKFLAKLASDMDKPDGLTAVPFDREGILAYLSPLPVSRIWGVGKATEEQLHRYGIHAIGDVQRLDRARLVRMFGATFGEHLYYLARGEDNRPVVTEHEEKSISNEETFAVDCIDMDTVRQTLVGLTEKVGRRLRASGKAARTGFIKVRFEDFTTVTRQQSFDLPTTLDRDLIHASLDLFEKLKVRRPVRLVGFGVSNLIEPGRHMIQPSLFAGEEDAASREQSEALDRAVDELRTRYGSGIIRRGL